MGFSVRRHLDRAVELAKQGEKNWECLRNQHPSDRFIILPHEESGYNTWAAVYYMIEKVCRDKKWVESLLMFYAFHPFSNRIVIISLTDPYDTGGENLLGVRGVTERELLCYDIYGFDKIPG